MILELQAANNSKSRYEMKVLEKGYFEFSCKITSGANYSFILDGKKHRPDPASRYQPDGVHGPSRLGSSSPFSWHDETWKGIPKSDLVIYEMHIGTFSESGTFESTIEYLGYLRGLGVTAIEIMPVAQFPGQRNWGYDGVDLFAPQNSYGGPTGLKKLVDACHQNQLSVILDVVYNHVGPEGNYLSDFGPYFSFKYKTPWGPAVNYDESGSDEVRKFVVQNACYWIEEFHIDGLRLDAVDKIFDSSPKNILSEIKESVRSVAETLGRDVHVIAESDFNDPKILRPQETGGYSVDAQWSDDFHHSVHSFLTGERFGYYSDFGNLEDIKKSLSDGFVYDGKYSKFREKTFGAPTDGLDGLKFVYFIQNHDQVGNRPDGSRLSSLLGFEKLKLAVALLIFSQSIPLLFMGEEYGEKAPFHYFVSHSEKELVKAVREGRRKEHQHFAMKREFVDPQSEAAFLTSKLNQASRTKGTQKLIFDYYTDIIHLRKSLDVLRNFRRESQQIILLEEKSTIIMNRSFASEEAKCVFVLGNKPIEIEALIPADKFKKIFDSSAYRYNSKSKAVPKKSEGWCDQMNLQPFSATVFVKS